MAMRFNNVFGDYSVYEVNYWICGAVNRWNNDSECKTWFVDLR